MNLLKELKLMRDEGAYIATRADFNCLSLDGIIAELEADTILAELKAPDGWPYGGLSPISNISRRDLFAAAALTARLSDPEVDRWGDNDAYDQSWVDADAMLEADK